MNFIILVNKRILNSIKSSFKAGRLIPALKSRFKIYLKVLKYFFYSPASRKIKIHAPLKIEPSQNQFEKDLVQRIFSSYKAMKNNQKKFPEYLPSSLWQDQLDNAYNDLQESVLENNIYLFHKFLTNFGTSDKYTGIEHTSLMKNAAKNPFTNILVKNIYLNKKLIFWKWFYNNKKNIRELSYPRHGNQCGAFIENEFIGIGSFFMEINSNIIKNLIDDINKPVICELGAGYGKLAYFLLRNQSDFCYLDFDLPELICVASYYLQLSFPDKKIFLYGENEFNQSQIGKYDFIFMPSFEFSKSKENSFDIFLNQNSLGEMNRNNATNLIKNACNATKKYFFHLNHNNYHNHFEDNSLSLLSDEYPINSEDFKLIFRYPDLGHLIHDGSVDKYQDVFLYLYEKRK
tara:strand:- start:1931 stop:3139 length:1209 start_codon:yes stop_codon:yes gene_type:complete